jgi:hypothetical protein
MFEDEATFGRISNPRSSWAKSPDRPMVESALIREFQYGYVAVAPRTGRLDYLMAPIINSETMSLFLRQVSRSHPKNIIIMIEDGASYHKS